TRADEIGAELEQTSCPQRQNFPVLVERKLAVIDHLAAAMVGEHALRAARYPFDGAPQAARRPQNQGVIGKGIAFQPEAAADVWRNDADAILRHMKNVRHLHAHAMWI